MLENVIVYNCDPQKLIDIIINRSTSRTSSSVGWVKKSSERSQTLVYLQVTAALPGSSDFATQRRESLDSLGAVYNTYLI